MGSIPQEFGFLSLKSLEDKEVNENYLDHST